MVRPRRLDAPYDEAPTLFLHRSFVLGLGSQPMRRSRRPIIIASRRSQLARVQAELVGAALKRLHPTVDIDYVWIESEGDQFLEASLADSGGKGLFAKAIEKALIDHRADLAVHSLKDLPTKPTKRLVIAAVPPREDVRDAREDVRDARENRWDRRENRWDRRH